MGNTFKITNNTPFWNRFVSPAGRNANIVISKIRTLEEENPPLCGPSYLYQRFLPNKKIAILRDAISYTQLFIVAKDSIIMMTKKYITNENGKLKIKKSINEYH